MERNLKLESIFNEIGIMYNYWW